MFGVSPREILIVTAIGLLLLAALIGMIVLLVWKRNDPEGDAKLIAQLREENRRLQTELAGSDQKTHPAEKASER